MTTRLALICHASTAAVRASAFPADEPLDAHGCKTLAGLAYPSGHAERLWMSPTLRARQTARALGLDAVGEPCLRECDYGRWTGQTLEAVQRDESEAVEAWLGDPAAAPHGGESICDLIGRVAAWLDRQNGLAGKTIAVTHASVMKAVVIHAIDATHRSFRRIDIGPLSVVELSGFDGRWTLKSIGSLERAARPASRPQRPGEV